jgi:RNA polymerase-binding transcription factor DksA
MSDTKPRNDISLLSSLKAYPDIELREPPPHIIIRRPRKLPIRGEFRGWRARRSGSRIRRMPPISQQPYPEDFLAERRRDLERARAWLLTDLRTLGADPTPSRSPIGASQRSSLSAFTGQELSVSPHANARALLREVEDALARLEAGLYGWDPAARTWIRPQRLAAVPTARHEIERQPCDAGPSLFWV